MIQRLCTSLCLLLISYAACSQTTESLKILFDISSKDTLVHAAALRHIAGIAESHPEITLQVVVYGTALPLVLKEKSTTEGTIQQLAKNKNITFKICAITMNRYGIKSENLIPGVEAVPDAIIEIAIKQGQGWSYIKESH